VKMGSCIKYMRMLLTL